MMILQEIKVAPFALHFFFSKKFNVILTPELLEKMFLDIKQEDWQDQLSYQKRKTEEEE